MGGNRVVNLLLELESEYGSKIWWATPFSRLTALRLLDRVTLNPTRSSTVKQVGLAQSSGRGFGVACRETKGR